MNATKPAIAVLTLGIAFCPVVFLGAGDDNMPGHSSDFNRLEYYPAPHELQVKTRLSGAEATPLGAQLAIKQLRLETFDLDGKTEIIVTAPDCIYDPNTDEASSAGPLQVRAGDGRFSLEGTGFLWRQNDSFLNISNNVHSTLRVPPEMKDRR